MKRIMRFFVCLCLMLSLFLLHQASAAASCKKLINDPYGSFNNTFTSYDITGDGKKDHLRFKANWSDYYGEYMSFEVYVNGSSAYILSTEGIVGFDVYYIRLKNGKKYLLINGSDCDDSCMVSTGVYKYQNGKLVCVKRLEYAIVWSNFWAHSCNGVSVSGNTITVRFGSQSDMVGTGDVKASFSYAKFNTPTTLTYSRFYNSNNKNYLVSNTSKAIPVYKTAGKSATVTKIKKGMKLYPIGVKKVGGKVYYRVKVGSKKGYIATNSSYKFKYKGFFI